jgi:hypothetical protein
MQDWKDRTPADGIYGAFYGGCLAVVCFLYGALYIDSNPEYAFLFQWVVFMWHKICLGAIMLTQTFFWRAAL